MPDSAAAVELRRTLRRLVIATIILYLVVCGLVVVGWLVSSNDRGALHKETSRTRKQEILTVSALCRLRGELNTRAQATEKFLKGHPKGIPGIPLSTLKTSLKNEQATIKALNILKCPSPLKKS